MKTCEDVLDLLPDALAWIRGEALEVYDHLKVCLECTDAVEEIAHTVEALQEHGDAVPVLSVGFADNVLAALPRREPAVALVQPFAWALRLAAAAALFAVGLGFGALAHDDPQREAPNPAGEFATVREPVAPVAPVVVPAVAEPVVDPFAQYAAEAALVLQAVDSVETSDPEVLRLLAYHVQRTQLLDHGERLLASLREAAGDAELEFLINGTQLILRKVRNARADSASQTLWTIREEVRQTGILDAYRELLTAYDLPTSNDPL